MLVLSEHKNISNNEKTEKKLLFLWRSWNQQFEMTPKWLPNDPEIHELGSLRWNTLCCVGGAQFAIAFATDLSNSVLKLGGGPRCLSATGMWWVLGGRNARLVWVLTFSCLKDFTSARYICGPIWYSTIPLNEGSVFSCCNALSNIVCTAPLVIRENPPWSFSTPQPLLLLAWCDPPWSCCCTPLLLLMDVFCCAVWGHLWEGMVGFPLWKLALIETVLLN